MSDQLVESTVPLLSTNDFIMARRVSSSPYVKDKRTARLNRNHKRCMMAINRAASALSPVGERPEMDQSTAHHDDGRWRHDDDACMHKVAASTCLRKDLLEESIEGVPVIKLALFLQFLRPSSTAIRIKDPCSALCLKNQNGEDGWTSPRPPVRPPDAWLTEISDSTLSQSFGALAYDEGYLAGAVVPGVL
jgi:hypothetical protein